MLELISIKSKYEERPSMVVGRSILHCHMETVITYIDSIASNKKSANANAIFLQLTLIIKIFLRYSPCLWYILIFDDCTKSSQYFFSIMYYFQLTGNFNSKEAVN